MTASRWGQEADRSTRIGAANDPPAGWRPPARGSAEALVMGPICLALVGLVSGVLARGGGLGRVGDLAVGAVVPLLVARLAKRA